MAIIINNQLFENNPSGINPALIFKASVYKEFSAFGPKYEVFGTSEVEVKNLAMSVSKLDNRVDSVMIYGPENIGSPREPVRYFSIR